MPQTNPITVASPGAPSAVPRRGQPFSTATAPQGDQFHGAPDEDGARDPKTALIHSLESEIQSLQSMIQQDELAAEKPDGTVDAQAQQEVQHLQQQLDEDEKKLYELTGGQEGYSGDDVGSTPTPSAGDPAPTVFNNSGGARTGSYGGPGLNAGGVSPTAGPGNTAPSASYPTAAPQSGEAAVNIAESQQGKNAQDVNLRNYTAAGGRTNDCADFVSACLSDAGRFNKTGDDASVDHFKNDLMAQGYRVVPASQAKPGDVFMSTRWHHTELVSGRSNGQITGIGANGDAQERITNNYVGTAGNPGFFLQKSDGS